MDLLIRNVDDEVIRLIDAAAERLGLSRNEYLRRSVVKIAQVSARPVSREDLKRSLELMADLDDESVMARAW
jgi:hypothetical protein